MHGHHSHAPGHGHAHAGPDAGRAAGNVRALRLALAITLLVLVLEAIGGLWTGSLALLADAGHMLTDAGALALSLFAARLSLRPRDAQRSFGYGRSEILAALANGLLLGGVSVGVGLESLERLAEPRPVAAGPMLAIAATGLVANLVCAWLLAHADRDNLNMRSALWHVLGDALGSVTAILAALALLLVGFERADAVGGLTIALLLVGSAFRLVRDSVHVLLEGAPRELDLEKIANEVRALPGVLSIHDFHIWTVGSGFVAMSAHVDLEAGADPEVVRRAVHRLLHQGYAIAHTTIQTEAPPRLLSIRDPD